MSIDLIGRKLGPYEIVEFISGDDLTEVFRGYDAAHDRSVTIKIVGRHSEADPIFNARFRREAKAIAGLRHPNIVNVYDYGAAEGGHYVVMDYVEGTPLSVVIEEMRAGARVLDPEDITFFVRQIAAALDYAHRQGVVHRAVTPASVVFTRSGQAILAEFGLSLLYSRGQEEGRSGTIFGPAEYMAPELIADARAAAPASDIYSLGVIVYELLTLERPYESDSDVDQYLRELNDSAPDPRLLNPDIPEPVATVVQKALSREARNRFRGAMKFAEALETAYKPGARVRRERPETANHLAETLVSSGTQQLRRDADGMPVASRPTAERVVVKRGLSRREEAQARRRLSREHRRRVKEERRARQKDFVLTWWRAAAVLGIVLLLLGATWGILQTLGILQVDIGLPNRPPIVAEVTEEASAEGSGSEEGAAESGAEAADADPTATPPAATAIPSPTPLQESTATPIPALAFAPLEVGTSAYRLVDGGVMQFVPGGTFEMGTDNQFRQLNQRPAHTVMVSDFWIDRTEVTNGQYGRCVADGPCDPPVNTRWFEDPDRADHPAVYVRYTQAVTYCLWLAQESGQPIGLPTEAQWEKAARWNPATNTASTYPWGEEFPNRDLLRYAGSGVGSTAVVGSYPQGASAYGVLDMAGNVWEWVADWYAEDTYQQTGVAVDPTGPRTGDFRVFRGGGWLDDQFNLESTFRTWARPTGSADNLGFRCATNTRRPVPDSGIFLTPLDLVNALAGIVGADTASDTDTLEEYATALEIMQAALASGDNATALTTATARINRLAVHREAGLIDAGLAAELDSGLGWIVEVTGE